MADMGLEGAAVIAAQTWERAADDPHTWTARGRDGLLYIMTSHRESGHAMIDVSAFLRSGELLREWRWTLGSTFDKLPDGPVEGNA